MKMNIKNYTIYKDQVVFNFNFCFEYNGMILFVQIKTINNNKYK